MVVFVGGFNIPLIVAYVNYVNGLRRAIIGDAINCACAVHDWGKSDWRVTYLFGGPIIVYGLMVRALLNKML